VVAAREPGLPLGDHGQDAQRAPRKPLHHVSLPPSVTASAAALPLRTLSRAHPSCGCGLCLASRPCRSWQDRNLHKKMFGGHLMRLAFELSYATSRSDLGFSLGSNLGCPVGSSTACPASDSILVGMCRARSIYLGCHPQITGAGDVSLSWQCFLHSCAWVKLGLIPLCLLRCGAVQVTFHQPVPIGSILDLTSQVRPSRSACFAATFLRSHSSTCVPAGVRSCEPGCVHGRRLGARQIAGQGAQPRQVNAQCAH
jgi:hypothetical protein